MPRSLTFPETLVGVVTFEGSSSSGATLTRNVLALRLRWYIGDLDLFLADDRHRVVVSGVIRCETLGGDLPVSEGWVELFAREEGRTVMNYRLRFAAGNDEELVLTGQKAVVHDRPRDLWPDTTTLLVRVRRLRDEQLVLSGSLRLSLAGVLRAVAGMRATGGARSALATVVDFDRFFVAQLASVYLAAVRRPGIAGAAR